MSTKPKLYDPSQSYAWNYKHAPTIDSDAEFPGPLPGDWKFCGLKVDSPIGISAGPLLNGAWCLHYAQLGFDVLTYKTVRSVQRDCYPIPNLVPVASDQIDGHQQSIQAVAQMNDTWAVSFGMPSAESDVWRRDVEETRKRLPDGKILSVSVVGTMQDGWGIDELASDYALCARWAIESGADCVETNFSCPNVATCDGQLYQNADASAQVVRTVRGAIGDIPYIIKVGHEPSMEATESLIASVGGVVDAIALTNSIAAAVRDGDKRFFEGQRRGICGEAIRDESISQVRRFREVIERQELTLKLIGVGGIRTASHVQQYFDAGAHACHLATAAMIDPGIGIQIRDGLRRSSQ